MNRFSEGIEEIIDSKKWKIINVTIDPKPRIVEEIPAEYEVKLNKRKSGNNILNQQGKQLLEWSRNNGKCFLNGDSQGDGVDKYTFSHSKSVLDYMLASESQCVRKR